MFGNNKKKENTQSSINNTTPNSNALNSLVKGTVVEGTISSESDIRIDGTIKGQLTCSAKVIIGPSGFVDGEITCENALVEGRFVGTLKVKGLLHVKETANISGDISMDKFIVDPGAVLNGTCNMGGNATSNGSRAKQEKEAVGKKAASK